MAQRVQSPYRASDLLHTATTIAAVALALGTVAATQGPTIQGVHLISTSLLFAGIFAVAGALYAMHDVKKELSSDVPNYFFFIELGLWITAAAYVAVLIDNLP